MGMFLFRIALSVLTIFACSTGLQAEALGGIPESLLSDAADEIDRIVEYARTDEQAGHLPLDVEEKVPSASEMLVLKLDPQKCSISLRREQDDLGYGVIWVSINSIRRADQRRSLFLKGTDSSDRCTFVVLPIEELGNSVVAVRDIHRAWKLSEIVRRPGLFRISLPSHGDVVNIDGLDFEDPIDIATLNGTDGCAPVFLSRGFDGATAGTMPASSGRDAYMDFSAIKNGSSSRNTGPQPGLPLGEVRDPGDQCIGGRPSESGTHARLNWGSSTCTLNDTSVCSSRVAKGTISPRVGATGHRPSCFADRLDQRCGHDLYKEHFPLSLMGNSRSLESFGINNVETVFLAGKIGDKDFDPDIAGTEARHRGSCFTRRSDGALVKGLVSLSGPTTTGTPPSAGHCIECRRLDRRLRQLTSRSRGLEVLDMTEIGCGSTLTAIQAIV